MIRNSDFAWVCDLVRQRAAIVLDDRKRYLVESRLGSLARHTGHGDIPSLILEVRRGGSPELRDAIVDAMTTNETSFYRDARAWEALQHEVLPDLIARRSRDRRLRLWSAACSTGQEPYTLAMVLRSAFPQVCRWDLEIVATDISPTVLQRAERGTYRTHELSRGLEPSQVERFFEPPRAGGRRIRAELRDMVQFRQMNLAERWPVDLGRFDLVFVRNVLIYFDTATKRDILGRMESHLASDGYLLLGSGETTLNLGIGLRRQSAELGWFYRHG